MLERRLSWQLRTAARLACLTALSMLSLVLAPTESRACGYHDDVSIARGILNWTYPDALHVIGAISSAVIEKRLLHEPVAPSLFGSEYRAAVKSLEQLGGLLRATGSAPPLSFSLVLVESMLWTRFENNRGELQTQLHVGGPQAGDLILISGEDVIRAVANGGLSIAEAHERGLIRLYGDETQIARFLGAFKDVGGERRFGLRDQTRDTRDPSLRPAAMQ
jgi:hypothetical protein